jgi:hypothetical protein
MKPMGSTRVKSLHHNLEYQNPVTGGKNVQFHRSHRAKRGRRDHHYIQNGEYLQIFRQKDEERIEKEEKRWKTLAF